MYFSLFPPDSNNILDLKSNRSSPLSRATSRHDVELQPLRRLPLPQVDAPGQGQVHGCG